MVKTIHRSNLPVKFFGRYMDRPSILIFFQKTTLSKFYPEFIQILSGYNYDKFWERNKDN